MSFWDANYLFDGVSETSWVPENIQHPEIQSSQNTRLPDLNEEPDIEPAYVQQNSKEFVYGGQPSYVQQSNQEFDYGGESSYVQQSNHEFGYGWEPSYVQQSNQQFGYGGDTFDLQQTNQPEFVYEPPNAKVVWETNQDFMSREELVGWAVSLGRDNGYVIVTRRSKKKGEMYVKTWLECDRSGEHNSTATVRRSGSKKTGCPFKLVGIYDNKRRVWKLQVRCDEHNHDPAQHLEGHPFMRRLSQNEYKLVEQLTKQNMDPRNILSTIKKQYPDNVSVVRDIYNAKQKMKNEKKVGDTPMQVLENLLHSEGYVYYTREDPDTNVVEEVFFCHRDSYATWRAFPHVLMIDATYKTNMYKLPFVQIVGVTSTHKTFCIAHAFVSKEREENYIWVLERVKDMLHKCMEPRVIITDRDLALMNACNKVFPDGSKYLCRWHISENILKHCKASFSDEDWRKFKYSWSVLCESPSPEIYEYNYNELSKRLVRDKRQKVLAYLNLNWLGKYKEMFVSAWTNKTLNFGQRTTNRVESQHANLKRYLKSANSSLATIVGFVSEMVEHQETNLKLSFEESKIKIMNHHKLEMFDYLRGKVSHKALDLLSVELSKLKVLRSAKATCGCQLFTSCGLPCACRLAKYENTGHKY